jgi:uncharacterized protein (DUF433 family)
MSANATAVDQNVGVTATTKSKSDNRFETPLYTISEAARALEVPTTTFGTWARGYEWHLTGRGTVRGEPIVTCIQDDPGLPSIPFVGLAEGMVLAAMRRSGVPMQRIRPAILELAREIGVDHALASRHLYTDGAELLYDFSQELEEADARAIRELVVIRSRQRVFVPVVEQYLRRIEYARDGYAKLIRLPGYDRAEVIVDPKRAFGQPIFASSAVTIQDVLERFWAGEDIETVSKEFGVPSLQVEDVVRANSRQAA